MGAGEAVGRNHRPLMEQSHPCHSPSRTAIYCVMTMPEIKVVPDPAALAAQAAGRFVSVAREAIAERGRFAVALAGGHTPEAMFRMLAQEPCRSQVEWEKVQVFF